MKLASSDWKTATERELSLAYGSKDWFTLEAVRMWWNWQTRYFEVVVPQGVQVQILPCAPIFFREGQNQLRET